MRTIPSRVLPVPATVSPELQQAIALEWTGSQSPVSFTAEQWKALVKERDAVRLELIRGLSHLRVSVEETVVGGVRAYRVRPVEIAPENRNRLLVHLHGGSYVFFGGEAATAEAIQMAYYGAVEVLSIDYRMPPDHPFPAAIDDVVAVWKELLKTRDCGTMAMFGTSAGGGLALAAVLRLRSLGLPLPGALMAGTPWSDLTKTGDTYFTNELVDNVLGSMDGQLEATAKLYAGGHDMSDPLLSPVHGEFSKFPPTVLLSGTRDLFLSNTVRVHQKMLRAGVTAHLLVFEGQSHAQYALVCDSPESAFAFGEVGRFFDVHLRK